MSSSILRTVLGGFCLTTIIAPALALRSYGEREEFGPARDRERTSADKRLMLAYLPDRVYFLQKSWSGPGFQNGNDGVAAYQGDAEAVNRALAEFALLPADTVREIQLLPAPGVSRSLKRQVTQSCDFEFRWSSAESRSRNKNQGVPEIDEAYHEATLVIYVDRAAPSRPLDPRATQWIKDLDSDRFTVRQAAVENLGIQRDAALSMLQESLDAKDVTLEARRRIEQLMKRLEPIHATRLRIPHKIPVFGPDDLLKREAENWRSGDRGASWMAAHQISALAEFTEESFPLLIEMLHDDREQVRDLAVVAFEHLGSRASGVVPALKASAPKKPASGAALTKAFAAVTAEAMTVDPWRQNRQRRAEIAQFLREWKKQ
jgi:hypothetical protein